MKTAILILFAAAAFAQTSDSDRLKIRDAQRIAAETVAAGSARCRFLPARKSILFAASTTLKGTVRVWGFYE